MHKPIYVDIPGKGRVTRAQLDALAKYLETSKKNEVVPGTNCGNCRFNQNDDKNKVKVDPVELNDQGGLKEYEDIKRGQKADLITLPGKPAKKDMPKVKTPCGHKKVKQHITDRMCCAFWDNPGIIRPFKKVVGS